MDDDGPAGAGEASGAPEEELSLPKATMNKLIQELMPKDLQMGKEAKEALTDCCVEFIHLISTQANEICDKEQKKTITGDHVVKALKELEFNEYVEEIEALQKEHDKDLKQQRERKGNKNKLVDSGLSEEELLKQQQALFEKARAKMDGQLAEDGAAPTAS